MRHEWIDTQTDSIKHWLTESACPMMASGEDGTILWANQAAEVLLGYSSAELVTTPGSPGLSWQDLTIDQRDLVADKEMIEALINEERADYTLQKSYLSKAGQAVPSMIHVLRWPPRGPVDCLLVTLLPLGQDSKELVSELTEMRRTIAEMIGKLPTTSQLPQVINALAKWANENRAAAAGLLLWVSTMIAGDRVVEVAERIKLLIWP
jgi:PAS domain S-box-containing protein